MVVTALGFRGMGLIDASLKTVYEDRTICLVQLDKVLDSLHQQRYRAAQAVTSADPAAVEGADADKAFAFRKALEEMEARIKLFIALPIESLDPLTLREKLRAIGHLPATAA